MLMNGSDRVIRSAIATVVAVGLAAASGQALAAKGEKFEKCAGIVKAGKNDCGTSHSSCHGSIKEDGDKEAWIKVPKGTCEKIMGAYVTHSPYARPGGKKGA
jgi:uncharacterized membrane protein